MVKKLGRITPAYIFEEWMEEQEEVTSVHDFPAMERIAERKLKELGKEIALYVNGGIKPYLISVLNAASKLEKELTVYYYNKLTGDYVPQYYQKRRLEETSGQEVSCCLIDGRHEFENCSPIYHEIPKERVLDISWLEKKAGEGMEQWKGKNIRLYLTGLSSAVVSALNAAREREISVVVMHYDIVEEKFFEQKVV